jgi:hypothetical protein
MECACHVLVALLVWGLGNVATAICALLENNKELANELIASVRANHEDKLSRPSVSRVVARVEIASEMDDNDVKDIEALKQNSLDRPNDVGIGLRLAKALFM